MVAPTLLLEKERMVCLENPSGFFCWVASCWPLEEMGSIKWGLTGSWLCDVGIIALIFPHRMTSPLLRSQPPRESRKSHITLHFIFNSPNLSFQTCDMRFIIMS